MLHLLRIHFAGFPAVGPPSTTSDPGDGVVVMGHLVHECFQSLQAQIELAKRKRKRDVLVIVNVGVKGDNVGRPEIGAQHLARKHATEHFNGFALRIRISLPIAVATVWVIFHVLLAESENHARNPVNSVLRQAGENGADIIDRRSRMNEPRFVARDDAVS